MSYDDAIKALSTDALRFVKDGYVIGLGSGRAATALVRALGHLVRMKKYNIKCVPTSLQIKLIANQEKLQLIEADQVEHIDVMFDGADQIDSQKFLIKGGGGALLRENILFSLAKKVIVMVDKSKFVKNFNRTVPIEVHPLARNSVTNHIKNIGGNPTLRSLDRGYPFFTENGNIILDCNFGVIKNPKQLLTKIKQIVGVMEVGIFTRKPDIIYKAKTGGKFEIIK